MKDIDKSDAPVGYIAGEQTNMLSYKDSFDHEAFYEWCIKKHEEGHQVVVSEYSMPYNFICLWSKKVNSGLDKNKNSKKAVEKLFTINTNRYMKMNIIQQNLLVVRDVSR